ncbi:hypothetical protein [Fibrobacter sp.]|uniref:hypothetical protein n=1 Tax=Fibrobacter sp. TaxID=35828 RepID=UPI0026203DE1|nr:hypothetical protein [Fibrobacter sp.]MDD5943812.1 hypothetical protein [Fibrobacter sp.]
MKISEMRNVFAFCLGSFTLLAGCGGFTEDVNGNIVEGTPADVNQMESVYALARVAQSGKVERSSAGDSITIVFEINGGCVKDGESLAYDPNFFFADSQTFAYSFRGDTLLLSTIYEPGPYEVNQERYEESFIFVGGTPGVLDGIWKNTQCRYREEKIYCMNDGYDQYFKFDGGKVEIRVVDREDYDYMQTVFVNQLFDFIGSGGSIQLETPYYYSDTKYEQEEYGIGILEKTNTAMKFTYGDLTFDLSLDYAYYKDSLSVTLKSGDVTCVGKHREIVNVPPEMCNADYVDNFYEIEDTGLLKYEKKNDSEFEACIDGILGR